METAADLSPTAAAKPHGTTTRRTDSNGVGEGKGVPEPGDRPVKLLCESHPVVCLEESVSRRSESVGKNSGSSGVSWRGSGRSWRISGRKGVRERRSVGLC